MIRRFVSAVFALFALTLMTLSLGARPARAQLLDLTFSPSAATLVLGDVLIFDATLTNTSATETLSLVGFGANLSGPDVPGTLVWDTTDFEAGLPFELEAGGTYTGQMALSVLAGGTPGVYVATYSVDAEDTEFNFLTATADLTVTVNSATAAVPEPGSLALGVLGGAAGLLLSRRRSRTARV
jgi:PEP-CTERM putative exosortase interaction domain